MSKSFFNKEQTKIRRKLNRHRRRVTRQVLLMCHCESSNSGTRQSLYSDDPKILTFKNTSGWLTW